jgi:hypothetical protein
MLDRQCALASCDQHADGGRHFAADTAASVDDSARLPRLSLRREGHRDGGVVGPAKWVVCGAFDDGGLGELGEAGGVIW